jgi:hypothetical protein
MVKFQPSKLAMRVRFPLPALPADLARLGFFLLVAALAHVLSERFNSGVEMTGGARGTDTFGPGRE